MTQASAPSAGTLQARVVVRVVAVLVAALLLSETTALAARAHVDLVASVPAQGERVPLGLDRVVLTFGEELLAAGAAITVHDPRGDEIPVGATGTRGETAEAQVALELPGRHTLTYRVVGRDGHVVSGSFWFTVVAGAPPDRAATSVSRGSPPGASATADAPGSVMWVVLVVFVLGVLALHRAASRARHRRLAPDQLQVGTDDGRATSSA